MTLEQGWNVVLGFGVLPTLLVCVIAGVAEYRAQRKG